MSNQPPATDPNVDPAADPGDGGEGGTTPSLEDLQASITKMQRENAGLRGELKKRDQVIKSHADSQMSDQEKLVKERDDLKAQIAERDRHLATVGIQAASVSMAARLGFNDPEDAYKLLDGDEITIDSTTGKATNLEELLKAILERKPYLGREQQTQPRGGTSNPGPRTAPGGKLDMNEVLRAKVGGR